MDQTALVNPVRIDVFSLPEHLPAGYRPETALFVDVLRATTTITAALSAGVKKILPVMEPKQALTMKKILEEADPARKGTILLGGERKGVKIDGFDLGNSPESYTPEVVGGKTLIFSTTNGTRAILIFERNSGTAEPVSQTFRPAKGGPSLRRIQNPPPQAAGTRYFLASFLNARELVSRLRAGGFRSVGIVCSGTDRRYTEEDILLAGLLVSRLAKEFETDSAEPRPLFNVQAETVRYLWETFCETVTSETFEKRLCAALLESRGGQNLRRIKMTGDIHFAARLDSSTMIPEYRMGEIRPATF